MFKYRHQLTTRRNRRLAIATALASVALAAVPAHPASAAGPPMVQPGESIQAAIDSATPGSVVRVAPGRYAEQLVINTDGIQLRGDGVILVPPSTLESNACTGIAVLGPPTADGPPADAGICIVGDVTPGPFDEFYSHRPMAEVRDRVADVKVQGFSIEGFGVGVLIAGGDNVTIHSTSVSGADAFGMLATSSPNTRYLGNLVRNGPDTVAGIGLCQAQSDGGRFVDNHVAGFVVGLCLSSSHLLVTGNRATDNHFGIFVDPGTHDTVIADNELVDNRRVDPFPIGVPTGFGLLIEGAQRVTVRGNTITGNFADNGDLGSGGLVAVDSSAEQTIDGLDVRNNTITGNGDGTIGADVIIFSQSTNLRVRHNTCDVSFGVEAC